MRLEPSLVLVWLVTVEMAWAVKVGLRVSVKCALSDVVTQTLTSVMKTRTTVSTHLAITSEEALSVEIASLGSLESTSAVSNSVIEVCTCVPLRWVHVWVDSWTSSLCSCTVCREGEVQLFNGTSLTTEQGSGRVEVCYKNSYYSVCDHRWDVLDASVVCSQLNRSSAGERS